MSVVPRELFAVGQIRLAELSVYNWGSFHGLHHVVIDPGGTLVTGDNGTGKSTLVDGLMALLLPPGRSVFNIAAAQGDRSDRSLMSYVRGTFGSTHDGTRTATRAKREGATVTALRALFRADDGSQFTIASVLWTTRPGNNLGDLKRLYLVARRNLTLEAVLRDFGELDVRQLKQRLKDDPQVAVDDHFSAFEERWRTLLHLENRNAPALLRRALGLKKIDDLTTLIRELVLEPANLLEDARRAVSEFEDLTATHMRLVDARAQADALAELPRVHEAWRDATARQLHGTAELDALAAVVASVAVRLLQVRIDGLEAELAELEARRAALDGDIVRANEDIDRRHAAYLDAGGRRLEALERELDDARRRLEEVSKAAADYQRLARSLGLDDGLNAQAVADNQAAAARFATALDSEREAAQEALIDAGSERNERNKRLAELEAERTALARRGDSNIDVRYQTMRDRLCDELGLDADLCRFVGELIDVADAHKAWHGAIERALGGLRLTLLVPQADYPLVTRWLNRNRLGLHARALVAGHASRQAPHFREHGYLRRLEWRKHQHRDWLKQYLTRYDLECVDDTDALDRTEFSMTQAGLIHRERGRFEKQDQRQIDDRRYWNLGFSNADRLALVESDMAALTQALVDDQQRLLDAREALQGFEQRAQALARLRDVSWAQLDVPGAMARVEALDADVDTARRGSAALATAESLWHAARQAAQSLRRQLDEATEARGRTHEAREQARRDHQRNKAVADHEVDAQIRASLDARLGDIRDDDLPELANIERKHRERLQQALRGIERELAGATSRASGTMASFRRGWPAESAEFGSTMEGIADYLDYLGALQSDGLPALVEDFRARLNHHTTQSLARIRAQLDDERDTTIDRIDTINAVLRRTEFRAGSNLRLGVRHDRMEHVRDFERKLTRVLSESGSEDDEARFAHLREVIGVLEKASTPDGSRTLHGRTLLDPRYRMSFYAEELDAQTGAVRDVLESSSGKSGGEKEAFAGTVVAASLAYVLTPDGHDRPVYCTVFLDEAFSNTAEAVSRRVLRVFRELNIHVNLITPFKNLNLARESARRVLLTDRKVDTHESSVLDLTWEELDTRREARRKARLQRDAAALGIDVQPAPPH